MTECIPTIRSQKARANGRKSKISRLTNGCHLNHLVRLFGGKGHGAAPAYLPRVDEDSVYIVPHIFPGPELYPSPADFAEFFLELHRSSDRYPSPEVVPPFLKSGAAATVRYDGSFISPELDPSIRLRPRHDGDKVWDDLRRPSQKDVLKAIEDLQLLLRENYPSDNEDRFEFEGRPIEGGLTSPATPELCAPA